MDYSMPSLPVHHQLLEFTQTHVHWVGDAIQPSHPLSSSSPSSSIFLSIRVFSNESALHIRLPKYWSFSISPISPSILSIRPSNEYSGLTTFRIDWFDLLAIQRTLKILLQHHSLKASFLQCTAFFMVYLSHPYMTTGKSTALTIWAFVCKVISLLFNMLSSFVIAFLPRSRHLLISCSDMCTGKGCLHPFWGKVELIPLSLSLCTLLGIGRICPSGEQCWSQIG